MEIYDILMLIILVVAVVFGAAKGMAWQIASIASLVVSYFVAVQFNEPVANFIKVEAPFNKLAAMLLLYLGTSLAIWIGFGFVRSYIEKMSLKEFDRHAGALLGAITGVMLCVSLTLFAATLLDDDQGRQYVTRSKSGAYITRGINQFQSAFPPAVHEVLEPYIKRLNEEMQRQNNQLDPSNLAFPNLSTETQQVNQQPGFQSNQPPGSQPYGQPFGNSNWSTTPAANGVQPGTYAPQNQPANNYGGYPNAPATPAGYNSQYQN